MLGKLGERGPFGTNRGRWNDSTTALFYMEFFKNSLI
jgi:hypothetical protein